MSSSLASATRGLAAVWIPVDRLAPNSFPAMVFMIVILLLVVLSHPAFPSALVTF